MEDNRTFRQQLRSRHKSGRFGTVFFLGLSLSMTVFSLYGAQASVFEKARATMLDVFEPVLAVAGAPVRFVNDTVGDVQDYFRIYAENRRLREENADLRVWMQDALSLRRQLSYYENLLGTQLPERATFIDASVIGETNAPYDHSLILSAGRKDGVGAGRAVVDDGGLIGHVVTAGNSAARVLMLTDIDSRVPVFIEDVQLGAILRGATDGDPVLDVFETRNLPAFTVGQRVVTSGADGMLPRGLPVGEIAAIEEGQISVRLFANTRTPDLVRVVDYAFPLDVGDETNLGPDDLRPAPTLAPESEAELNGETGEAGEETSPDA